MIDFGWTKGTLLALLHALPPEQQKDGVAACKGS
jgi:hypothetical protein